MLRVLFLLAAAMAAFAIAQTPPGPLQNQFGPVVQWRTIAQGDNSKILREEARMISGDQQWEQYYRAMIGARPDERINVPAVANWDREDVLVLHLGKRPTAGYAVYVETIGRSMSHYYDIHYVMQQPPRGAQLAQAETSPFVVIAIQKTTGIPRYFGRISTQSTYILQGGCSCGTKPVIMVGSGGRVIPLSEGGKCGSCGGKLPIYGPGSGDTGGTSGGSTGGRSGG